MISSESNAVSIIDYQKSLIKYLIEHKKSGDVTAHRIVLVELLGTIDCDLGNEYYKLVKLD